MKINEAIKELKPLSDEISQLLRDGLPYEVIVSSLAGAVKCSPELLIYSLMAHILDVSKDFTKTCATEELRLAKENATKKKDEDSEEGRTAKAIYELLDGIF